jgi:hypothetical protein
MRNVKDKSVVEQPAAPQKVNRPELDKLQGKVLAKDKYEKAVKSLEGAKFPGAS